MKISPKVWFKKDEGKKIKKLLQESSERNSDKQQPPSISFTSTLFSPPPPLFRSCRCLNCVVLTIMFISPRVCLLSTIAVTIKFKQVFNWKRVRNIPTQYDWRVNFNLNYVLLLTIPIVKYFLSYFWQKLYEHKIEILWIIYRGDCKGESPIYGKSNSYHLFQSVVLFAELVHLWMCLIVISIGIFI